MKTIQSGFLFGAAILAAVVGLLSPISTALSANAGDVIINEFVPNAGSGNEWVELLNTTASPIDLTGWTIKDLANPAESLSDLGTIPPNGIVVFEHAAGWLNNDPTTETITLFDDVGTTIHSVSYGSDDEVDVSAPGDGESAYLLSLPSTWAIAGTTPTKGWFNVAQEFDCVTPPSFPPTLTSIASCLDGQDISSNIGELDNPSATPLGEPDSLYFEKTGQGKIVFNASLNLTDEATVAILQSLGSAMEISGGHIKFDSTTADAMAATGAKIYMYGLGDLGYSSTPNIVIKDDDGNILGTNDANAVGDIVYDSNTGELSLTALHFTQFDVSGVATVVTEEPDEVSGDFTPEIGATMTRGVSAYLARLTTYTGPDVGTGDLQTIKWKVTLNHETDTLSADMVDLDEVGWVDQDTDSSDVFHYPFTETDGDLVALGSCDEIVDDIGHDNDCEALGGFSLTQDNDLINADKIIFDPTAPSGAYAIKYELVNTADNLVLATYEVAVELVNTPITVTADAISKTYGETDPELTYQITSGELIAGDAFTGAITRAAGEDAGTYAITQGTLALASYYDLTFVEADFTINFDSTINLTAPGEWALVSAPTLLDKAPTVTDDGDGAVALLVYENGEFVTPSADNEDIIKPVSAFFVKTTSTGQVGFSYANITSPTQTSKQLSTGWNLVGTNYDGLAEDEFSSIQDTETSAGMLTLYAPDAYNSKKDSGFSSWDGYEDRDLNARPITALPDYNLSRYDGYWVYLNAAKTFIKNVSSDDNDNNN